jgi:hypothetical protein
VNPCPSIKFLEKVGRTIFLGEDQDNMVNIDKSLKIELFTPKTEQICYINAPDN